MKNLPAVTIDIAPVAAWVPWIVALLALAALVVTWKAPELHEWSIGVRARREARRRIAAGNLDRRHVIRPGRWQ